MIVGLSELKFVDCATAVNEPIVPAGTFTTNQSLSAHELISRLGIQTWPLVLIPPLRFVAVSVQLLPVLPSKTSLARAP